MATKEPDWLTALRAAAVQRPRTQFQRVRWSHLALLLRDFDTLWQAATPETRNAIASTRPPPDSVRYKN